MRPPNKSVAELLALLDSERTNLIAQVERVPAARRTERPAEGQWSAAEIVEHVARVEGGIARAIVARAAAPLTASAEEIAAAQLTPEIIAAVRTRESKLQAPERVQPTGMLSGDDAFVQLANSRAALRAAFVDADPAVLDGALVPHPYFGPLTLRAWVELIAYHDARHAQQAAECAAHWATAR
jgi:hypothetical protein